MSVGAAGRGGTRARSSGPAVGDGPPGGGRRVADRTGSTGAEAPRSAPARWSLRVDGKADGATNMATDHTLALTLEGDEAVLRLYGWLRPTLSLGRNEPARGRYDPRAVARRGVDVVRRPTGGRAVLHHREVTYAVAAPLRSFGGLRTAYRAINRALVRGLGGLGAPAALAGPEAPGGRLRPGAGACFRAPAAGEVVAAGDKLVGSAQARIGDALLQHGSILLADDQALVEALRGDGAGSGRATPSAGAVQAGAAPGAVGRRHEGSDGGAGVPTTLAALLGRIPPTEAVVDAVADGFRTAMGGEWRRASEPRALPPELVARYRSAAWTWRR